MGLPSLSPKKSLLGKEGWASADCEWTDNPGALPQSRTLQHQTSWKVGHASRDSAAQRPALASLSPRSQQFAPIVCAPEACAPAPHRALPSQLRATPSFQLLRPQALALSLPPLCLSHPPPTPAGFPVGSAFKIHQKSKYFSPLPLPPSWPGHCPLSPGQPPRPPDSYACHCGCPTPTPWTPPVRGVTSCHSHAWSVAVPSHFILNKSPWFSMVAPCSAPCHSTSSAALPFPTDSAPATWPPCSSSSMPGMPHHRTFALLFQSLCGRFCLANPSFLHICSSVISVNPTWSAYLKLSSIPSPCWRPGPLNPLSFSASYFSLVHVSF